jgi:hypothetical protein
MPLPAGFVYQPAQIGFRWALKPGEIRRAKFERTGHVRWLALDGIYEANNGSAIWFE